MDISWTCLKEDFREIRVLYQLIQTYTPRLGKVLHQMFVLDLIRKLCFKIMLKIGGVNPADIITVGSKVVPPPQLCLLVI